MSLNKTGKSGMIIALSIAMLGATTVVMYGALQVEAAPIWCYEISGTFGTANNCDPSANKSDCEEVAQADAEAVTGKCFNQKKIR